MVQITKYNIILKLGLQKSTGL